MPKATLLASSGEEQLRNGNLSSVKSKDVLKKQKVRTIAQTICDSIIQEMHLMQHSLRELRQFLKGYKRLHSAARNYSFN